MWLKISELSVVKSNLAEIRNFFLPIFAEIRKLFRDKITCINLILYDFPHHFVGIFHFAISEILYTFAA